MTNAELIKMVMEETAEKLKEAKTQEEKCNIQMAQNATILSIVARG